MKKKNAGSEKGVWAAIKTVALGTFLGAIFLSVILIALSAGFAKSGNMPDGILPTLLLGFVILGSLMSGFVSGRIFKSYGLLIGLTCGLVLLLILLVVKVSFGIWEFETASFIRYLTVLLGGGIGGILGVNKKNSPKNKRKAIKKAR